MSTSRHMGKICITAIIISLALTIFILCGAALNSSAEGRTMGYEDMIFDTASVHTIDIVMNDWDEFIETCESEEYSPCAVVIDGESYKNIGIRAKGNTSLSSVRSMDSTRYSFKLEFDHYEDGKTYHGLDKLCLNNLIQDNTMMKDYLVYQMMGDFGVDAPLCSYAYITVNGENWGLYLAVESVEDSFLQRNYGNNSGNLYKPDSMSFGGGRGNGKDFNFDDFDFDDDTNSQNVPQKDLNDEMAGEDFPAPPDNQDSDFPAPPDGQSGTGQEQDGDNDTFGERGNGFGGEMPNGDEMPNDDEMPSDAEMSDGGGMPNGNGMPNDGEMPNDSEMPGGGGMPNGGRMPNGGGMNGGARGSDDVKLKYIDDNAESYSNIFDNAKTDITSADKMRLISSLKNLSEYTDLENTVDIDEVIRYFVVHNFVCNGDSYTGSMIHNYYLHEQDGQLAMIPWDYNLAFGSFQGGNADSSVNADIDNPVSGGSADDRPMVGWIFSDEKYTQEYHELFSEFVERWFSNGQLARMIEDTQALIRPYVEKDPTKFCTTEEFDDGVQALETFVTLRAEAVSRQLSGDTSAVDTSGLDISAMGNMGMGGGFGGKDGEGGEKHSRRNAQFSH